VLALKTLCGFGIREIALSIVCQRSHVYKRLGRARSRLRKLRFAPGSLPASSIPRDCLRYTRSCTLYSRGYLSSHAEVAIRAGSSATSDTAGYHLGGTSGGPGSGNVRPVGTDALHAARMTARQDSSGGLLPVGGTGPRTLGPARIQIGLEWLARSSQAIAFPGHAEAGIAADTALPTRFRRHVGTKWWSVSALGADRPLRDTQAQSCVAVAEWQGPERGLAVLKGFEPPTWLAGSYIWAAVLADLHRRCGNAHTANRYRDIAANRLPLRQ